MVPCAMWNSGWMELGGLFGVGIIVSPARTYLRYAKKSSKIRRSKAINQLDLIST